MKMIGIDGGATKVAGAQVIRLDNHTFDLVEPVKEIQYKTHKSYIQDFEPLALSDQVESKDMSELESRQAEVYIECIVNILDDLINDENVKVFIAMPGIKTLDKRGIKLMANGPRIPNLCDEIEKRLTLKNKIQQIESDADMCAWGEEFGKKGEFRNIENAYYIGGGTGTADGLKLGGKLISFDDASKWIAKTWELMIDDKTSLEFFSSMSGIKKLKKIKSEKKIGLILGRLIFERINTIFYGWNDEFKVNRDIKNSHPYKKTLLDKIVFGQRLSEFLQSEKGSVVFSQMMRTLTNYCLKSETNVKNHFINNKVFDKDRIILSNLRSAPIIGLVAKSFYNANPR